MRNTFVLLGSLFGASLLGCSGGGPPTQQVSGTVTMNGQPVADAQIGFHPTGTGETKPASGMTDAQGRYTLNTYVKPGQQASGAMVGDYKVTVTQGIADNRIVEYDDLTANDDGLPAEYAEAGTTPLTASVTDGGENEFDFTLETQATN